MTDDKKDLGEIFKDITGEDEVKTNQQNTSNSRLRGTETDARSKTTTNCPECGHNEAYYEMKQIRAADESETRFFECVECGHKWREDDH